MTLDQLITSVNSALTRVGSNRVSGSDVLSSVLNVISYFATQISSIIPLWTDSLTFQQDGSDDGRFCRYADTNGKIRLFETKVDDNINNAPPTNPVTTENSFWREVSASASAAIPEWAAGVYGPGLIIVYHNHSVDGKGLYVLVDPARPYTSANIETEITAADWERIGGSGQYTREFQRAFTETLTFNKNEIFSIPEVITDDITYTIAASGHLVDQASIYRQRIIMDGTNSISFGSGFDHLYGITNGEIPAAGTYEIYFLYTNGSVVVSFPGVSSETSSATVLATPANFAAVADGETEIDLSWDDVANESSYLIEFSLDGSTGWTTLSTPAADATTASQTGLSAGVTRFYRIRAIGDGVNFLSSPWATASAMTESGSDVTPPDFVFLPASGNTDWPVNKVITITADESIRNTDGSEITNANVASRITLKETNSGGSDIPFTATIDGSKKIITITPNPSYGENQLVYVAINNVEDVNGNEVTVAVSSTFTTTEHTFFDGTNDRLQFGDILDTLFAAADTNFWLELTIKNQLLSGFHPLVTKWDTGSSEKTFQFYHTGTDVFFGYSDTSKQRYIKWTNVLTAGEHVLVLKYDGSLDTNDGLDRAVLEIDTVVQGSKTLDVTGGGLPANLRNSTCQLAVGARVNSSGTPGTGFYSGQAKDFIIRSTGGTVVEINVPILRTGEDTSGNNLDGTWV